MRRQDPLNKKAGARGYVCKFGLDRSGPSWLSSIAVRISERQACRAPGSEIFVEMFCKNLMWKCSQKAVRDVRRNSEGKQTSRL